MYTILLITHIATMILSMSLMSGAIGLGILGKDTAVRAASLGMVATTVGAITGVILLLFAPILSACIALTAYLAAVTSLYIFGFGSGLSENARFIRRSASIQKR